MNFFKKLEDKWDEITKDNKVKLIDALVVIKALNKEPNNGIKLNQMFYEFGKNLIFLIKILHRAK